MHDLWWGLRYLDYILAAAVGVGAVIVAAVLAGVAHLVKKYRKGERNAD